MSKHIIDECGEDAVIESVDNAEIPQWLKNRQKVDRLIMLGGGRVVETKTIMQQAFAEAEQTIEEQVAAVNNGKGVN